MIGAHNTALGKVNFEQKKKQKTKRIEIDLVNCDTASLLYGQVYCKYSKSTEDKSSHRS